MTLSVLTLNLWHDSGPYLQRARIREWIDRLHPDLIGFHEALRGPELDQVAELLAGSVSESPAPYYRSRSRSNVEPDKKSSAYPRRGGIDAVKRR